MRLERINPIFPRVSAAFDSIHADSCIGAMPDSYIVPDDRAADLPFVEAALAHLTPEERDTLCNGERDDQIHLAGRSSDNDRALRFLLDFFNGWERP